MESIDQRMLEVMEINCNEENNMCQVSKQLQQLIYEHFLEKHSDAYIIEDQYVQQCDCADSKELQKQLVNHLISHLMPTYEPKEEAIKEEFIVETLDPDDYLEAYKPDEDVVEEEIYVGEDPYVETEAGGDNEYEGQQFILEGENSSFQTLIKPTRTTYKCSYCEWECSKKKAMMQHLEYEHDETNSPLCCPYAPACPNVFKSQKIRRNHINWHKIKDAENELGQLVCPNCNIFCDDKESLLNHIKSHNRYYCDYCPKSYISYHTMKVHVMSHVYGDPAKPTKKMILCDLCSQLVPSERLKRHLYTFHCDEKLYSCQICSKEFKHAESLKNHLDVHKGQPRFQCEYCQKTFFNNSNYKNHLFRHTEPDRFKCSICYERYASAKSLEQHFLRKHETITEDEKVPCLFEGCGKTYLSESLMKAHFNRTHIKKAEEPQPCPFCKYVANSKKNIQRHKWRVHQVKTRNQKIFTD